MLLAEMLAPALTNDVVNLITCVGSVLIIGLAFNMVCGAKLKILNYMPAVILPVGLLPLSEWISAMAC